MVVTSTDNPMNEGEPKPVMRLGSDPAASPGKKGGKKPPKAAADADDDGGYESTAHFMDDVFGSWLTEDSKPMTFRQLTEWSEVRAATRPGRPTPSSLRPPARPLARSNESAAATHPWSLCVSRRLF